MVVSVVVPIYNSENYLDRCVRSVLNQTFGDLELILINDGSTDKSSMICHKWAAADSRVKVYDMENHGVSFSRNYGICNSAGDYLYMLDSDDYLAPNTLELLLDALKKYNSDCVVCGLNQSSGTIWAPPFEKHYDSAADFQIDYLFWLNTELLSCSVNKLYRKELVTSLYPEEMSFAEDLVFCLNYLRNCKRITFIPASLYQHDVSNMSSITHSFNMRRFADVELMQDAILEYGSFIDQSGNINAKYIRDAISIVRNFVKSSAYTADQKKKTLEEWYICSHLKKISIRECSHYKDKIIVLLIRFRLYNIMNLIWNR